MLVTLKIGVRLGEEIRTGNNRYPTKPWVETRSLKERKERLRTSSRTTACQCTEQLKYTLTRGLLCVSCGSYFTKLWFLILNEWDKRESFVDSVKSKAGCFGDVPESQQWLGAEVAQQQNSDLQTLSSSCVCSLCALCLSLQDRAIPGLLIIYRDRWCIEISV